MPDLFSPVLEWCPEPKDLCQPFEYWTSPVLGFPRYSDESSVKVSGI